MTDIHGTYNLYVSNLQRLASILINEELEYISFLSRFAILERRNQFT